MTNQTKEFNEKDVLGAAIQGDQEAFGAIYENYIDEIYRFIYLRVEDQQTAEDITSTVFMKAWENLSSYEIRKAPFRAWIYRIARNAVIDHYRTRKSKAPLEAVMHLPDEDATSVAEHVAVKLEGEEIADFLPELTEDQRNVLVLKFVQGYSTKEVARALDKRQGAIRALQMRALQALAKLMETRDD